MLNSTLRLEGNVPVVILEGRLDATGGTKLQECASGFPANARHAILGLDRVDYISSAGIRVLLILERNLRKAGGSLILAGLSPFVSRTLATGGLRDLRTAESVEAALAQLPAPAPQSSATHRVDQRLYSLRQLAGDPAQLVVFEQDLHRKTASASDLIPVTLTELGYSMGVGGFGNMREQALQALGSFIAIGNAAGVLPAGEGELTDFVVVGDGVPPVMYVQQGVGLSGSPVAVLDLVEGPAVSVDGLLTDLAQIPGAPAQPLAFLLLAWTDGSHSPDNTEKASGLVVMGVTGQGSRVRCQGLLVDRIDPNPAATRPEDDLAPLRNVNRLRHVVPVDPDVPLEVRRVWIFAPASTRKSTARQSGPVAYPAPANRPATRPAFDFLKPTPGTGELGLMGPYRVVKLLGKGGMGIVFEAIDAELHQRVALKVMKPELCSDTEFRQRFIREAKATAAIKSNYIVKIHHVGEQNDIPYFAMEFLEGDALHHWQRSRQPKFPEILTVAAEAARGLAAAHAQGLLHRDIKPDNIWVEKSGAVKLLDFGLTCPVRSGDRLTQAGKIVGTPEYMSPEQARGSTLDERSDLFSFGCVLYELAAHRPPFRGDSIVAVLTAVATAEPEPLESVNSDLPTAYRTLVASLLKKDPAARPASASEVVMALEAVATAGTRETVPALPRRVPPRPRPYGLIVLAALAILAALAGIYLNH